MTDLQDTYKRCLAKLALMGILERIVINVYMTDIVVFKYKYGFGKQAVYIPYGVTALADGSFSGTEITEVSLSESIVHIGHGCFSNCPYLKTISIHRSQEQFIDDLKLGNSAKIVIKN